MTSPDGSGTGTVLQISSMVPPSANGGAERVVAWLRTALEDDGWRVHDAGLRPRGPAEVPSAVPIRNLYWPWDGTRRDPVRRLAWHAVDSLVLAARRQVEELVDATSPDVVVTHNLRGWGYAPWVVAGERGIPLVHVVHDYGLICNSSALWRGGNCTGLHRDCAVRRDTVDRRWPGGTVVGVSHAVLAEHDAAGLAFSRAAVVAPPLADWAGPAVARAPRDPGVPVTVGYLGRLSDIKGVELLLAAARPPGSRLLLAGEGEAAYVDGLRAAGGPDVEWLGWVDTESFLDRIDVLAVPSLWREPLGLVVVEAARAGVPVLLADRPGLVEAARSAGALHTTFRTGDVGSLSAALHRPIAEYVRETGDEAGPDLVELIRQAAGRRS
ncbi:glycosyltransferase [Modestobacter versicolor]|uniref:glycosyltransferase n=1 Tax=Modestobacter versicolor TaxID=429133 RepID=UPI0034DF4AD3